MRKSVEEIIETIKALKGFKKDYEVASLLGIGRGALSNAKQRNAFPFFDQVAQFCERENHSLDILRHGSFQSMAKVQIANNPGRKDGAPYGDFVRVNVLSLTAGTSAQELSETEPVDTAVIPRELYSEDSLVVQMNGDSMEKLLMNGSNALIDTGKKNIVSGSLYALKIPHEGNIVRECCSEPQGLSLIPYNKNYPTSRVLWKDFNPDMVIGKISCTVLNVFR